MVRIVLIKQGDDNMRNKIQNILIVILTILGIMLIAGCTSSPVQEKIDQVSVRLPIPTNEAFAAAYYTAIDQGFYAQENLKVTFNLGSPETNPVKMVSIGADNFGILGGPDTLLVAKSNGQPLVAIAVLQKNSNFPVLLTLKDSNITKLEQLQGKKVGFFYGHITTDVLRTAFRINDIKVEEVDVGFNYAPLIAKQVNAEWAFRTTAGINLPAKGVDVNVIAPSDYGVPTDGYTIFTTETMIKNNPELVERFLRATLKGVEFTKNNPDVAIESLLKKDPSLNKDLETKRLGLYNEVTDLPAGLMDKEMFQGLYNRLKDEKVIKQEFNITDSYTTKFLDKIYAK